MNLEGHVTLHATQVAGLADKAAEVPYAAQAVQALRQAADQLEVARAYLEARPRAARIADTDHYGGLSRLDRLDGLR